MSFSKKIRRFCLQNRLFCVLLFAQLAFLLAHFALAMRVQQPIVLAGSELNALSQNAVISGESIFMQDNEDYGPFAETPVERELALVELNVTSLTGICGAALPYLDRGSSIINVASLAAYIPLGNFAVYAASKSYVRSFSLALAAELKDRGIHVMALCPGSVATEFAKVASNGARKEVLHGKPVDKVVRHALVCQKKGRHVALWAFKWKFNAFMSFLVNHYRFARHSYLHHKRPYQQQKNTPEA